MMPQHAVLFSATGHRFRLVLLVGFGISSQPASRPAGRPVSQSDSQSDGCMTSIFPPSARTCRPGKGDMVLDCL
jgi:hypothetical protein